MTVTLKVRDNDSLQYPSNQDEDYGVNGTLWAQQMTQAVNDSAVQGALQTYDEIVGTAAQVAAGEASQASLQDAIDAISAGGSIFVKKNTYTLSALTDVDKSCYINGEGPATLLQADASIAADEMLTVSASDVIISGIAIDQGTGTPDYAIAIDAALDRVSIDVQLEGTFAIAAVNNSSDQMTVSSSDRLSTGGNGTQTVDATKLTMNTTFDGTGILDEDDMASDSDDKLATQQSIKKYVDDQVGDKDEFVELDDTPANYTGSGGKLVAVNSTPDGLEFVTSSAVDHDATTNTHNLTTDIDHDTITNGSNTSGIHGVTGNVVGTTDIQALTNKDIDGDTASDTSRITLPKNTTAGLDALTDKEATIAYDTDRDNIVYNDGTDWQEVGSGSGGGGINYISNGTAESGATTGWSGYDDGAVDTPVDGTGGTATNLTLSAQDTTVLRGDYSFKLAKAAADAQGEGVSYDFAIDSADINKRLSISFDWQTDTTYESDDIGVWIYDVDNTTMISPSSINLPGTSATTTKIQVYYNATDSSNYRLIFHVRTTEASAYDVYFDNVSVGPQDAIQATTISDWSSFTPTMNWNTNLTFPYAFYKRVGDEMLVRMAVAFSGQPSPAGNAALDVPLGLTIDSSKLDVSATSQAIVGTHAFEDNSARKQGRIIVTPGDDSTITVGYFDDNGAEEQLSIVSDTSPSTIASGDQHFYSFRIPIAEWAGASVGLANSRVEYASYDGTNVFYGPNGSLVPTITISATLGLTTTHTLDWLTPIQSTDNTKIQIQQGGVGAWIDLADLGYNKAAPLGYARLMFQDMSSGGSNDHAYGIGLRSTSDTSSIVHFGLGGAMPNSYPYGANGANYPTTVGDRYRVVKSSNPISVGATYGEGTYTPTITNTTNVSSSTARKHFWTRQGDIVTVFGRTAVTATTTTNTWTKFEVSLPITAILADSGDLNGSGGEEPNADGSRESFVRIQGDTANNTADCGFYSHNTGAQEKFYSFRYSLV